MPASKPCILAQRIGAARFAIAVLGLSAVAAFGLPPDVPSDPVPARRVVKALPLPEVLAGDDGDAPYWREERIARGDTIGSLLARAGVDDPAALQFVLSDSAARPLYQLRPGVCWRRSSSTGAPRIARSCGAFLWRAPDGSEGYCTEDGRSSRKAFLRSPMEFSRITSGFTLARFHPILRTWRAHRGTDFAAPVGTPPEARPGFDAAVGGLAQRLTVARTVHGTRVAAAD